MRLQTSRVAGGKPSFVCRKENRAAACCYCMTGYGCSCHLCAHCTVSIINFNSIDAHGLVGEHKQ